MAGVFEDRGTLQRIVATLLVLALLAERAVARSLPVRFAVLAVLGWAEKIARAFVAREMAALIAEAVEAGCTFPDFLCPDLPLLDLLAPDEPSAPHYGAAGAQLLALRLSMLAALLGMLAGEDSGSADDFAGWAPHAAGSKDLPLLLVVRLPTARRPLPRLDTS